MPTVLDYLKSWFWRRYRQPLTVAVDRGPFWGPRNQQEEICHVYGLVRARRVGRRWVRQHPNGQARILEGHHKMLR